MHSNSSRRTKRWSGWAGVQDAGSDEPWIVTVGTPCATATCFGPAQLETTTRQAVLALAARLGLRTPETWQLDTLADLRRWAETEPLPWVLKVDGSWGGFGVRVVHSLAEAERAFRDLAR